MEDWHIRISYPEFPSIPAMTADFKITNKDIRRHVIEAIANCWPASAKQLSRCPVGKQSWITETDSNGLIREIDVRRFA